MGEDSKQWQQWFHRELLDVRARLSECEGMHRKDEQRSDALSDRVDACELSGKASVVGRVDSLEVHAEFEKEENTRWHGELRRRVEALERDTLKHYGSEQHVGFVGAVKRIEALEKRDTAERIFNFVAKDHVFSISEAMAKDFWVSAERAKTAVLKESPTCGTCRWFKQDDPSMLFDPKRTGMCQAHPCVWAKTADMTCGEHSPRE